MGPSPPFPFSCSPQCQALSHHSHHQRTLLFPDPTCLNASLDGLFPAKLPQLHNPSDPQFHYYSPSYLPSFHCLQAMSVPQLLSSAPPPLPLWVWQPSCLETPSQHCRLLRPKYSCAPGNEIEKISSFFII